MREAIAASSDGSKPAGAVALRAKHIAVTSGGVNALMLAAQALLECGDVVAAVTLVWPDLTAQSAIMGARVICVSLRPPGGQWQPDMGELEFNTICAPAFVQRAKLTAFEHTGDVTPQLLSHLKLCRDALVPLLQTLPGARLALSKKGGCALFSPSRTGPLWRFAGGSLAAGAASRFGSGGWQGFRGAAVCRGARLAAMVFRQPGHGLPGAGRGAAGTLAWAILQGSAQCCLVKGDLPEHDVSGFSLASF